MISFTYGCDYQKFDDRYYFLRGTLLDADTQEPAHVGKEMTLRTVNKDLFPLVRGEDLGTFIIQPDGRFAILYKYTRLGDDGSTYMEFYSDDYTSPQLETNQHIKTTILVP